MKHESITLPVHYTGKSSGKNPLLVTYLLDNYDFDEGRKRPLVLICPGGAYAHLSEREAERVAIKMNSLGFQSAILYYTLSPMEFPAALCDLAEAVYYARTHAQEWHIDSDKIIVAGFSAGAHLAASLGAYWNGLNAGGERGEDKEPLLKKYLSYSSEEIKPNALLLCYPVITAGEAAHRESINNVLGEKNAAHTDWVSIENLVTSDFPTSFIWHTTEDNAVPAENSLLLSLALQKQKIPFEYHLFQRGRHGLALATDETSHRDGSEIQGECAAWINLFASWAKRL